MQPVNKKEMLKAARHKLQPDKGEKAPGPSEGRTKTTTRGPPAPRLPTGRPPIERPREEPEEPPKSKRHKGSSSRREKEKEKEKEKGKAPVGAAPLVEPIDLEASTELPALRKLFRGYTDNLDMTGSLGTTATEVEENLLTSHAKMSCAIRHYFAMVSKLRKREEEAEEYKIEVARLDAEKTLLAAEKASLEEDLRARLAELKKEASLAEERRTRLEDLQKRYDDQRQKVEDQRRELEGQRRELEDQRQLFKAVEESVASEKEKAVADYLGSAEFKEDQTLQTAEMLQTILESTKRRLAKRCPGLDTGFLYEDSDEETEVTGAAPEAAPGPVPEAGATGTGLEEGEVVQPIELPPTPPTPPTPHCEIP